CRARERARSLPCALGDVARCNSARRACPHRHLAVSVTARSSHKPQTIMDDSNDEYRCSASALVENDSPTLDWTLALAGGEGVRLADYVQRRFGHRIPKQYCAFLGKRSMLEHTLERLNRITPASRTLTVIGTDHGDLAAPQLVGRSDHVFRQPS